MNANIYRSMDGSLIGTVENFDDTRYENACSNPEGHVRADDVLDDDDMDRLGLTGDASIYATAA